MAKKTFDVQSKMTIMSSFTLSNDDVSSLSLLYAPLIGSDALLLYLAFESFLERNNLKSEDIIHQDFLEIYSLNANSFLKARYMLEGIGLLNTYTKDNSFIYVICPPLTPKNFLKDVTLGLYLYSKVRKETFDLICKHFKIERVDKANFENITKSFDEVFDSKVDSSVTYEKFQYILGKNPSKRIKLSKENKIDFDEFAKNINLDFLETGITEQFKTQIITIAFVYRFDVSDMISLFNDSINKSGLYDYRLLKKKANILFNYKRNMKGPILESKDTIEVSDNELINYLNNISPSDFLEDIIPNYPPKYLDIINDIYINIELPRGVLNCMIMKIVKEKGGELPSLKYFQKVSESWIKDNIFSTDAAIKYVTEYKNNDDDSKKEYDKYGGFDVL